MTKAKKITLKSIAEALNVTHTTVSNAYNRPEKLSPELKEKILSYAEKVGYDGPSVAARFLQTGQSGTIGIVFNKELSFAFSDPHALSVFRGIAEVCEKNGLNILLLPLTSSNRILSAMVDGYIFNATFTDDDIIKKVIRKQLPIVTIDLELEQFSSVAIDNRKATREMTNHLLNKGHREIGFLSFPFSRQARGLASLADDIQGDNQVSINRLKGVKDAIAEAGADLHKCAVYEASDDTGGWEGAEKILTEYPETTALMCFSDQLALEAMRYCQSQGLRVPEDIAVTGFDNIPDSNRDDIQLTTVSQNASHIGRLAAETLLSGKKANQVVEHELIIRSTS